MAGKANINIHHLEVSYANPALHSFTAGVELKSASDPYAQTYSFKIAGILEEQERKELDDLIAKVVERLKREFKNSFV
jgi:hypothetical protein